MGLMVKICGIARQSDVEPIAALRPDAMGFICWPGSLRYVEPVSLRDYTRAIPEEILKVGVFVNQDVDEVLAVAESAALDVIQLHGGEDPALYTAFPGQLWSVVHINRTDLQEALRYPVDAFLVDSYSTEALGGTGLTADWSAAAEFVEDADKPVLLAGGLSPENVEEAVSRVRPDGVDVSSGVERQPSEKDLDKVERFIERCRKL